MLSWVFSGDTRPLVGMSPFEKYLPLTCSSHKGALGTVLELELAPTYNCAIAALGVLGMLAAPLAFITVKHKDYFGSCACILPGKWASCLFRYL